MKDEAMRLMLNDSPDCKIRQCRFQLLRERDEREVFHPRNCNPPLDLLKECPGDLVGPGQMFGSTSAQMNPSISGAMEMK
jgi:hypothetical protein